MRDIDLIQNTYTHPAQREKAVALYSATCGLLTAKWKTRGLNTELGSTCTLIIESIALTLVLVLD